MATYKLKLGQKALIMEHHFLNLTVSSHISVFSALLQKSFREEVDSPPTLLQIAHFEASNIVTVPDFELINACFND